MAHEEYIAKIATDTAELKELLEVISQHANPVPSVLYTLASEKADNIALAVAKMRTLTEDENFFITVEDPEIALSPAGEDENELIFTDEQEEEIHLTNITENENSETKKPIAVFEEETTTDFHPQPEPPNHRIERADTPEPTIVKSTVPLDELLQRRLVTHDIRKAISINDRFRFRRELFSNNDVLMNSTIDTINEMLNFDDVMEYITDSFDWDLEKDATAIDFITIVKRRYL